MAEAHILLIVSRPDVGQLIERAVLSSTGYRVSIVSDWPAAEKILATQPPDAIILSERVGGFTFTQLGAMLLEKYPFIPLLLLPEIHFDSLAIEALRIGFTDYLQPPIRPAQVLEAVNRAVERRKRWEQKVRQEARLDTKTLRKRMNGLETIQRIGRQVTSMLELDNILKAVVDAAVDLSEAEEGSLMLIDEYTGELYVRASRNFQEDFVHALRLPITDTLAGEAIRSGKPVLINEKTPRKIKTSYLVYTIIYIPLTIHGRVIGVLEVDNRQSQKSFSDDHVTLISMLADYAAIAIENSRLYARSEQERAKLEAILNDIEDGVLVVDQDRRLLLMNQYARQAFGVEIPNWVGRRAREVIRHQELLELLRDHNLDSSTRIELALEDGRILNAHLTPIEGVGLAVTMQDITHLKELDRIKSDFVNTVSHDLRSPLTAILGYVELIERVGPVNHQQKDFIQRVQLSVYNITSLINDLLDLGRIEAGFDARNEIVPFSAIIQYAVDGLSGRAKDKSQTLKVDIAPDLPQMLGNPIRLRQMVNNILANAIRYTPEHGEINVQAHAEGGQIILQISDNGPGIPVTDQPYIFDKFYRGSNIPADLPGSGLGLAIVKSIVENHLGRIWVDSAVDKGTTFIVVLPSINHEL